MMKQNKHDKKLIKLVQNIDKELFEAGKDFEVRRSEVPLSVMQKLGHENFIMFGRGQPSIFKNICLIFEDMYKLQTTTSRSHVGVFMFRDVFVKIKAPMIFGNVYINPYDYIDLTPMQFDIMMTETNMMSYYTDQFFDICDVEYGIKELKKKHADKELVNRFINLSKIQLNCSAAILTGGYDYRGATQSALLATELALKAGVSTKGLNESSIKKEFGHDTLKMVNFIAEDWQSFDTDRVINEIDKQPYFVMNRYSAIQQNRTEIGHLVMGAQFIVSEVIRQISSRNFRKDNPHIQKRSYPY